MRFFTSLRVLQFIALLYLAQTCYCQETTVTQQNSTEDCYQNCTDIEIRPFCATDGVTYNSTCEMEIAACRENKIIKYREEGPCVVSTASEFLVKGETCMQHKERISDFRSTDEWQHNCRTRLRALEGNITIRDLLPCFRPECNQAGYAKRQCHTVGHRRWCWCSGPDGMSFDDTLSTSLDTSICSMRSTCHYEGVEHLDGAVFQPVHQCGICECLDGVVTCFQDFVPDMDNRLNTSQLSQLSDLLKKFFVFENNRKDSILSDIRKIITIGDIPDDVQIPILEQWFHHYDKNGNGLIDLNHSEETIFHGHIAHFTSCKHFLDHISEEMDTDSSETVTQEEWLSFFTRHTTDPVDQVPDISKRSTLEVAAPRLRRRSLEERKKFYYVL